MAKGKKPTAEQRKILERNSYDPHHWFYTGQRVIGESGYKRLGKDENKSTFLVFRNKITDQEIQLAV